MEQYIVILIAAVSGAVGLSLALTLKLEYVKQAQKIKALERAISEFSMPQPLRTTSDKKYPKEFNQNLEFIFDQMDEQL